MLHYGCVKKGSAAVTFNLVRNHGLPLILGAFDIQLLDVEARVPPLQIHTIEINRKR